MDSRHDRPSRGSSLWLRYLQAALQAAPSLEWSCPQYAISDGRLTTRCDSINSINS
ncbi:MAG: hypothetical protein PUE05_09060 [bacterium]|nr:hypothetical protein [bacterium]